jgi:hypothetical protein
VSLGLIMRLRIVAREHHGLTGACKAGSTRLAMEQQRLCGRRP